MPATGLEVDLPLIGTFPRTLQPDAGIVPDRTIAPTPADLVAGRYPVLATVV